MTQKPMIYGVDYDSIDVLLGMLSTCRPAWSRAEKHFIQRFILPIVQPYGGWIDKKGNILCRNGDAPILWSSHTDTVHHVAGEQNLRRVGASNIGLATGSKSSCLGADDTAGVWLMLEMLRAGVRGLYVFHRAEEVGCIGSRWIAKNNPKALEGIKFAVALDRRNKDDVITHQCSTRCCSDAFAESMSGLLNGKGFKYSPSKWGSFTDTHHYTELIGECTNLSVGYTGAHGPGEEVDGQFLLALRDMLITSDFTKLVEKRKPGEVEPKPVYETKTYGGGYYGGYDGHDWVGGEYYGSGRTSRYIEYPYTTSYGWYDANYKFHDYDADEDYEGNQLRKKMWMKNEYINPPKYLPPMKHEERRSAYQGWLDRVFLKSRTNIIHVGTPQTKGSNWKPNGGSHWFSRAKALQDQTDRRKDLGVTKGWVDAELQARGQAGNLHKRKKRKKKGNYRVDMPDENFLFSGLGHSDEAHLFERICHNHPKEVAAFMQDWGISLDEMCNYLLQSGLAVSFK